jgi:hypothetical protein
MRILVSLAIGLFATGTMLFVNWTIVPRLNHAIVAPGTPLGLATDLALCFFVAASLMSLVLRRRDPDGVIIAAIMAFCGWYLYFAEVGYFQGMLLSEYPFWYELFSFLKYPLAFGLAFYFAPRGANQAMPFGPFRRTQDLQQDQGPKLAAGQGAPNGASGQRCDIEGKPEGCN